MRIKMAESSMAAPRVPLRNAALYFGWFMPRLWKRLQKPWLICKARTAMAEIWKKAYARLAQNVFDNVGNGNGMIREVKIH
jgi:hypothetical protein